MYDNSFERDMAHLHVIAMRPEHECDRLPNFLRVGHIGAMGANMTGLSINNPPTQIEPFDQWYHVLTTAMLIVQVHLYQCAVAAAGDFETAAGMCTVDHVMQQYKVLISEWGNVYYAPKDE